MQKVDNECHIVNTNETMSDYEFYVQLIFENRIMDIDVAV
jgi:hypothetical protein